MAQLALATHAAALDVSAIKVDGAVLALIGTSDVDAIQVGSATPEARPAGCWVAIGVRLALTSRRYPNTAPVGLALLPRSLFASVIRGRGTENGYDKLNTGGRYIPSTDSWSATSTGVDVPSRRYGRTAVWTGTEMIAWGGGGVLNTGGRYNPSTDSWFPTSTEANVPSARSRHTVVWTGTEMIVWGGWGGGGERLNSGAVYIPPTPPAGTKVDYDADGWEDIGVFRNGMWFLSYSSDYSGVDVTRAFGSPTPGVDSPEIGEFGCAGGSMDSQRDLVILRKPYSTWMVTNSPDWGTTADLTRTFGTTSHKRIPMRRLDTNGDGCTDIGVFRSGCFYVMESPGYVGIDRQVCFGPGTDEPLAGDLDGDGKSDLILWRPATSHYTFRLSTESYSTDHGADLGSGDLPLVGDLNGDRIDDLGSFRQSYATFKFTYSPDFASVDMTRIHGVTGDVPMVADVNGDGTADIGVFRDSIARWRFLCSPGWSATCLSTSFGTAGDIPIYGKPPGM